MYVDGRDKQLIYPFVAWLFEDDIEFDTPKDVESCCKKILASYTIKEQPYKP